MLEVALSVVSWNSHLTSVSAHLCGSLYNLDINEHWLLRNLDINLDIKKLKREETQVSVNDTENICCFLLYC